jgi:hypothetical protein
MFFVTNRRRIHIRAYFTSKNQGFPGVFRYPEFDESRENRSIIFLTLHGKSVLSEKQPLFRDADQAEGDNLRDAKAKYL